MSKLTATGLIIALLSSIAFGCYIASSLEWTLIVFDLVERMASSNFIWNEVIHFLLIQMTLITISIFLFFSFLTVLSSLKLFINYHAKNDSKKINLLLAALISLLFFIKMHIVFYLWAEAGIKSLLIIVFLLLIIALFRFKIAYHLDSFLKKLECLKSNEKTLFLVILIISSFSSGFFLGIFLKSEESNAWQTTLLIKKESNRRFRLEQSIRFEKPILSEWLKEKHSTPYLEISESSEKKDSNGSGLSLYIREISPDQCSYFLKNFNIQQKLISQIHHIGFIGVDIVGKTPFFSFWNNETDPFFTSIKISSHDQPTDHCKSIQDRSINIELTGL